MDQDKQEKKRVSLKLKRLPEMDTIWHPESTLVFKSQKDKRVIGRWVDGKYIELDDTALDLTEQLGLKYDQDLYNELYSEEVEEVEEGGTEDNDNDNDNDNENDNENEMISLIIDLSNDTFCIYDWIHDYFGFETLNDDDQLKLKSPAFKWENGINENLYERLKNI